MLQRSFGLLLGLGAFAAAACAKFSGEDTPPPADAGSDATTTDAPPTCVGRTSFANAGPATTQWAAATALKSARLGGDRVWYVTVKDAKGSHIETRTEEPPGALTSLPAIKMDGGADEQATLSGDLKLLAIQSDRTSGKDALWISKRSGPGMPFETPSVLVVPGVTGELQDPYFVGNALYFASDVATGNRAIFRADVATGAVTTPAVQVTRVGGENDHPIVSADELEIFFVNKPTVNDAATIMYAQRAKPTDAFTDAKAIAAPGTNEHPTWLSPDGCDLWVIDSVDKLQRLTRRP